MLRRLVTSIALTSALTACGGGPTKPAEKPTAEVDEDAPGAAAKSSEPAEGSEEPTEEESGDEAIAALPTECKATPTEGICVPPKRFVDKLCNNVYPNIALAMFVKGSPWTRGFLTRDTKAWNASGGAANDGMLKFDEEVLVLRYRPPPKGGIQITGAGGYDVLRWDGSCVTLAMEEMTTKRPPRLRHAPVVWRTIQTGMRDALKTSDKVKQLYRDQRKECKGVTMGAVSKKCEKLTLKLAAAIVDHVRNGGAVATPERMPE